MKKAILVVAALVAVGVAVYLTKPGRGSSAGGQRRSERGSAASADGGPAEKIVYWSPSADAGPDASSDGGTKTVGSSFSGGGGRKVHGADAVVRTKKKKADRYEAVDRKQYPPDWSSPLEIPFRELKDLRAQYRRTDTFDEKTLRKYSGAAVRVSGAVMPIDPVPESGEMKRFWVANTVIVMAGCVFCFPPTMGDLVYVDASGDPYEVDREKLYRSVVKVEALGRLELGPNRTEDGVEYMFGMELKSIED
ncbi:MAG: hypothetical protein R6V85_04330 [Polyangia bacterium]